MSGTPKWKVFRGDEYVGACKYAEDAAAFVSIIGEDGTVRHGHSKRDIVWREGQEAIPAGESYDRAAEIMRNRVEEMRRTASFRLTQTTPVTAS